MYGEEAETKGMVMDAGYSAFSESCRGVQFSERQASW